MSIRLILVFFTLMTTVQAGAATSCHDEKGKADIFNQVLDLQSKLDTLESEANVYAIQSRHAPNQKSFCWWVGQASPEVAAIQAKAHAINTERATLKPVISFSLLHLTENIRNLSAFCQEGILNYDIQQEKNLDIFFFNLTNAREALRDTCGAVQLSQ